METALSLDTTFLIDLQKERKREREGRAVRLLAAHPKARLLCCAVAWGEFLEGLSDRENHPLAQSLRTFLDVIPVTDTTSAIYAQIAAELRSEGRLIGANDLWIASATIEHDLPLATRNAADFSRVNGLRVLGY